MKHIRSVVKKEGWLCAAYHSLGVLLSFLEVYWTKVTQLTLDDLSGGTLSLGRIACFGGVLLPQLRAGLFGRVAQLPLGPAPGAGL